MGRVIEAARTPLAAIRPRALQEPPWERSCASCGASFVTSYSTKLTCSGSCSDKNRAAVERKRQEDLRCGARVVSRSTTIREMICLCGHPFVPTSGRQIWCQVCRTAHASITRACPARTGAGEFSEGEVGQPIPGFPGYAVTELGKVYGPSGNRLSAVNRGGQDAVVLRRPGGSRSYHQVRHLIILAREGIPTQMPADAAPVPGTTGYYTTPAGEIWSLARAGLLGFAKRLSQSPDANGHLRVIMKGRGRLVHDVVIATFGPPRPGPRYTCRHIDGMWSNCTIDNLEWGARPQDIQNRSAHESSARGSRNGLAKLDDAKVRMMRVIWGLPRGEGGLGFAELGRQFGVSQGAARSVCLGLSWRHVTSAPTGR
jgi:hypothetical protein